MTNNLARSLVTRALALIMELGALSLAAAFAMPTAKSTEIAAPKSSAPALVSQEKLAKVARLYLRERLEVVRLRRVLAHDSSVSEALDIAAIVYGVPRGELSMVASCESGHFPLARNGQYRGLFQQGPMFEKTPIGAAGLSVWSPYAAALSTAYVVSQQGWRQWECGPNGEFQP